jgi:hypothetical protein
MDSTRTKPKRFKNWRAKRPFSGAVLSILSGLVILWVPAQLYEVAAAPGSMIVVGLLLGGLTLLMGVLSLIMPKLSTLLGLIAILSASLSIMGALGGFLIGTILGIIGGALCIAWKPEFAAKETGSGIKEDHIAEIEVASGKEILPD